MSFRALLLATAIVLPCSVAQAADFNVSTSAGLTSALSTAASNGSADRILLAAGEYSGAFSYGSSEDLELIGAGQNATELDGSGAADALDLFNSGATFHVADLTVAMATNTPHGIWISGDGTIERTTVTMAAGATGIGIYAVTPGLTVKHIDIEGGGGSSRGVDFQQPGAGTITDSTFFNAGQALIADHSGGNVTAARLKFSGPTVDAVSALFGASIALSDSSIDLGAHDGYGLSVGDFNNPSNFTGSIDARRVTIAGDGTHNQYGALVGANSVADHFSVALRDSVIVAVKVPLSCSASTGTGTIATDYSSLPGGSTDSCGGGITQAHPVTNANLGFVNAAGRDFRLRFDSPLVDAGDPSALAASTDLAGLPRPVNGVVDVGAYEYQRTPPALSGVTVTPASAGIGEAVAFSASASDADPGAETISLAWVFDDGATADGASVSHAFSSPGTHTATVTATDAAGAKSSQSVSVEVVAPVAVGSGTPPGGTVADATAPVLSNLRVVRSRGSFHLSEAATVSVTIQRRVHRRWRRARRMKLIGVAGANRITPAALAHLRPGRYRATLVARDASGNRSATRRVAFIVRRR